MAKKQSRDDTRLPDDSWTTEELEQYVRTERSVFSQLERKCVKARYRIGRALLILKPRLKAERRYRKWLAEEDISTTLEWEATKLAERGKCEADLVDPSITETLVKYGIIKRCRRDEDAAEQDDAVSQEQDADGDQQDDNGDQSSTLPPGTVAQMLTKPKAGSKKATAREAKGTASKSTKSKPTANPEVESQTFPLPAPDCIPTDAESEAALEYVRAIGDLERAFQVVVVVLNRLDNPQS